MQKFVYVCYMCVYNVHIPRRRRSQTGDDTEGMVNNQMLPSTGLLPFLLLPGFIGGWAMECVCLFLPLKLVAILSSDLFSFTSYYD